MPTKTQVVDGGSTGQVSGTVAVWNQADYPILISAPTKKVYAYCGVIGFIIEDISTSGWSGPDPQPNPPPGTELTFAIYIEGIPNSMAGQQPMAHEFVYISGLGDDDISRAFSVRVGARRIWRTETTSFGQGRDGKPVFANDVAESDEFIQDGQPWSWEATFGALSWSGTQTWDAGLGEYIPSLTAIVSLILNFQQHKGQGWLKYASLEDLKWSAANLNFSGMSKTYGAAPPGVGGKVTGGLGSLELTYNDTLDRTSAWVHGLPKIVDFSAFSIRDRDGDLLNDLRVSGPWQASLEVPATLTDWSITP